MSIKSLIFIPLLLFALGFFTVNLVKLISYLRIGKAENRGGNYLTRVRNVIVIAFGQNKLLRERLPGIMHFFIFWGFIVLLMAILESIGEGFYPGFSLAFLGSIYYPLIFMEDLLGFMVILSVLFALYRRYFIRPKRLEITGRAQLDATLILTAIFFVMLSMFLQNAFRISVGRATGGELRFLSYQLSGISGGLSPERREFWYEFFWWTHIMFVLGLLNYLPYSKHLHILSSIPNVFTAKLENRGNIRQLNLAGETAVKFGAADVEDLSWKQLLDGYTCTECGRCTAACPANITGKPLSPKKIIVDIRHRLMEKAPIIVKGRLSFIDGKWQNKEGEPCDDDRLSKHLIDNYITEDELWSCTTCMACIQECPVQIEHIDSIVEMRRYLVLSESRFPKEMQVVFQNLERNFTPWAFSHSTRADWANDLNIPVMADEPATEILFWVGCAGAYDARYQKVTKAFARLMQLAGVDFAILGTEEKCNGDPARRAGNEYLAQMLITENIATLGKYKFKKIVTTCPHCFNIIKNEYPQSGGTYEVVHHTDFIIDLIKSGKLKLSEKKISKAVYHDSCYLGRYNGNYNAPREAIESIPGMQIIEMERSKDKGFCCGAGGARMFMEEKIGKRINEERIEEVLNIVPDLIGTACPFCMTMITDGLKVKDEMGKIQVVDIAEMVLEAADAQ